MKSRKRKQLNKREHFKWGVDQQNSLDALISHPTIPTVIVFVDYAQPFILHTDASSSGLGGTKRVIAYASKSLQRKSYQAH